MAILSVIPDNKGVNVYAGAGVSLLFSPKNPDGSVKDMSGFTVANSMIVMPSGQFATADQLTMDLSGGSSGDATGVTVVISEAQVNSLITQFYPATSCAADLQSGDGTDFVQSWTGNILLNYNTANAARFSLVG